MKKQTYVRAFALLGIAGILLTAILPFLQGR